MDLDNTPPRKSVQFNNTSAMDLDITEKSCQSTRNARLDGVSPQLLCPKTSPLLDSAQAEQLRASYGLISPHTVGFVEDWGLLGTKDLKPPKPVAFPLDPEQQPGAFMEMEKVYDKIKHALPEGVPEFTLNNQNQDLITNQVRQVWHEKHPEDPFPENYWLNFWTLKSQLDQHLQDGASERKKKRG